MRCARHLAMFVTAILLTSEVCRADTFAYIERWATGTLSTGEPFESWRIHVVIPEGDDWRVSGIDAWLTGGPTWYYNWDAGLFPLDPNVFLSYADAEFATYFTSPHLYPNSEFVDTDGMGMTADGVYQPMYVHLGGWGDGYFDTDGDYVVFQGTVLNPIAGPYALIEFFYTTELEFDPQYFTFVIPEPAAGMLLVLGACTLLRRRG